MESYGLRLKHNLTVEYVNGLSPWTSVDAGRVLYDTRTRRCYVGKLDHWGIVGLYDYMIKESHLFTDDEITGSKHAISALHIPVELSTYGQQLLEPIAHDYVNNNNFFTFDSTSNVQFVFDAIRFHLFSVDFDLDTDSVNADSISFNTSALPYDVINDVQDKLNELAKFDSLDILLAPLDTSNPDQDFGYLLGILSFNIKEALVDIERYLSKLNSENIPLTISGLGETTVQFVFDELYRRHSSGKFIDLYDGPQEISSNTLDVIQSNGENLFIWNEPTSTNIHVRFPNVFGEVNEMENTIITNKYFHPSEICDMNSVDNTVIFGATSYSPKDFFSTSIQHGLEMIRELQCAGEPRALDCYPSLVTGSQQEFDTSTQMEQRKDDALCCPLTKNDNDEDWSLIFSSWHRFSHEKGYDTQPAIPTHLNAYALTGDGIMTTADTHSHNGVISFNAYDCFEFEVTLTSDTLDNDMIGVVVAFCVDSDGWEHTITAIRIHGSTEDYMPIENDGATPVHVQWALVYNYRQDTEYLIADGTASTQQCPSAPSGTPWGEETGWNGAVTRIKVHRMLNQITVSCTDWNTEEPYVAPLSVNLDSDARLNKFKGPQRYGYSAHSTMNATWERQIIDCLDCGTTNCRQLQATQANGCVTSSDPAEIASLKSSLPKTDGNCFGSCFDVTVGAAIPIDFNDVFNNWSRLITGSATIDNWHMDSGKIICSSNQSGLQYFLSPTKYERYQFELTVTSPDPDDDFIFIVIAGDLSGNNICAVRSLCACNAAPDVWPTWVIVYNFGQSDEDWLAWNDGLGDEARTGGWNGRYSRIKVCRSDDTISILASRFNSLTYDDDSLAVIDLNDDFRLTKFKGPQSIGFGCGSQNAATFDAPSLNEIGEMVVSSDPIPAIYDGSEDTLWEWDSSSCSWIPTQIELPCGGYIDEPKLCSDNAPTSCAQLDTEVRPVYDVANGNIYHWNRDECTWDKEDCPDWTILERNTIYYNDITCKVYYYNCDRQWIPLN